MCILFLSICASCSQSDKNASHSYAEHWNSKCPIALINDEISLTSVHYSHGKFSMSITLNNTAPTCVSSLLTLNEEYANRLEMEYYNPGENELGTTPFMKGLIAQSPVLRQLIDSIATLTYTNESSQGYLPLDFVIKDASLFSDSTTITYNEQWGTISKLEWMNAILPFDIQKNFGWTGDSENPKLNDEVEFERIPQITNDGCLKIFCSYNADPYFREKQEPLKIGEVREKYFNKEILEDYIVAQENKSNSIHRYLQACGRRGIKIKFMISGNKDAIDRDLASPEFVKEWESWGGNDSLVISYPMQGHK